MDCTSLLLLVAALLPDGPQVLGLSPTQVLVVLQQIMHQLRRFFSHRALRNGSCALHEAAESSNPATSTGRTERESTPSTVKDFPVVALIDNVCHAVSSSRGKKGNSHCETASTTRTEPGKEETLKASEPWRQWLRRVVLALLAHQVAVEVINTSLQRFAKQSLSMTENAIAKDKGFFQKVNNRAISIMSQGAASSFRATPAAVLSVYSMLCRIAGLLQRMAMQRVTAQSKTDQENGSNNDASEIGADDKMTRPVRHQGGHTSSKITGIAERILRLLLGKTATKRPDLGVTSAAINTLLYLQQAKREVESFKHKDEQQTTSETSTTEEGHNGEDTDDACSMTYGVTTAVLSAILILQRKFAVLCSKFPNCPYSGSREEMSQADLRQLLLGEGLTNGQVNIGRASL
ncbi:hypothetical protein TGPRC2_314670 [Toxoplasma gondii TgCatPRC2]|uniref:Uncharacterized protein n=6 Tax=Toxoplasma gondii TaxID=5811 RepID=B6K9D3_TOXGV|nr:hypothetical protein TGME49_314670 [Toxoplasma gondii ME49]ESS35418.1 hypothetical protein TGVEG_314670 [Toxoplasma gondii VEG]KFG37041.1 hypothetical protein TGDOM2_314670 [Toxoplasma gondii GAB2-2007-GAL-DOM2]KYF40117.1 hypothetical protein TGARI_314670 [Toxoplasma gondii ARI]KYK65792.1 hypothetical protein TGPRC2_314670 [Toxoplasma gondii TgCatPRC2]PIM00724.1 hypothetical protein TGCOUG_314670 [Toxoplasma gondii COUG]|eukprot:XP_002364657.1 hypothetical protein TGME49_314670 [Toxoplasma gondii ME49]